MSDDRDLPALASSRSLAKPATRQYRSRSDSPSGGRASGSITRFPATPLSAAGTATDGVPSRTPRPRSRSRGSRLTPSPSAAASGAAVATARRRSLA